MGQDRAGFCHIVDWLSKNRNVYDVILPLLKNLDEDEEEGLLPPPTFNNHNSSASVSSVPNQQQQQQLPPLPPPPPQLTKSRSIYSCHAAEAAALQAASDAHERFHYR